MEENSLFNYWFTFIFALCFIFWFPVYVIKTRGRGLPSWWLAVSIMILFMVLPLLSVSLVRDVIPSLWLKFSSAGDDAANVNMLVGSIIRMATLDKVYLAVALLFLFIGATQSCVAAWCLYIRHNYESLIRSLRLMWTSAFMIVLAAGALPLVMLRRGGLFIAYESAPTIAAYIILLMGITAYLHRSKTVRNYYPPSHTDKNKRKS